MCHLPGISPICVYWWYGLNSRTISVSDCQCPRHQLGKLTSVDLKVGCTVTYFHIRIHGCVYVHAGVSVCAYVHEHVHVHRHVHGSNKCDFAMLFLMTVFRNMDMDMNVDIDTDMAMNMDTDMDIDMDMDNFDGHFTKNLRVLKLLRFYK